MNYGFGDSDDPAHKTVPAKGLRLPSAKPEAPVARPVIDAAVEAGQGLGFVARHATARRKPGPKRTEPQGKITVTGPQRVLDRLQTKSDAMGGAPYWQVIEALLDHDSRHG